MEKNKPLRPRPKMEIGGDVDALAAALSLADGADLFLTDLTVDLTADLTAYLTADLAGSLQSFAPSGTVFAPLGGEAHDAWQAPSLPDTATPVGTTERRAARCEAEESPQTEGTDSDGQSQGSCGSSCGRAASASRTRAPSKPAAKKRALNYNPNRAREERRKEVIALRLEAAALESQLATLQNVAGHHQRTRGLAKHPRTISTSIAHTVWKTMAERQLGKRLEVSRENGDLKAAVRANHSTIRRMAKLVRSVTAERVWRHRVIHGTHLINVLTMSFACASTGCAHVHDRALSPTDGVRRAQVGPGARRATDGGHHRVLPPSGQRVCQRPS